jgi:hypothetical protein
LRQNNDKVMGLASRTGIKSEKFELEVGGGGMGGAEKIKESRIWCRKYKIRLW